MTPMSIPQLLYHTPSSTLYPTNSTHNLLVIRLSTPVRVSSVRITPEGVEAFSGYGVTSPSTWDGELFFNVSPSSPVNAMVTTRISIQPSEHDLDYEINMPEGVTTRLIILKAPVKVVTLSIYGWTSDQPAVVSPDFKSAGKEDFSWVTAWAGGLSGVLNIVGNPSTSQPILDRAVQSLSLIVEIDPSILTTILKHTSALNHIFTTSLESASQIQNAFLTNPELILDPRLRSFIPSTNPLFRILSMDPSTARREAWRNLDIGRSSLLLIRQGLENGQELLDVPISRDRSNLSALLEKAEEYARRDDEESLKCLKISLEILSIYPEDAVVLSQLARRLPPLLVLAKTRECTIPPLTLPAEHAKTIISTLIQVSTTTAAGKSCYTAAKDLAKPYMNQLDETDPLRTFFTVPPKHQIQSTTSFPDTPDGRALQRFQDSLSSQTYLTHSQKPLSILSLIAPEFLKTIQKAPQPLLGIPSSLPLSTPDSGNQASAWAGKVYTSHEFRSRDGMGGTGLGIHGVGMSGTGISAGAGGGGLGVGGKGARPASRHVDELR